jgi:hypothetical protein
LGFEKKEIIVKKQEEKKRIEEEAQESIVLEKPRRTFSFDTVEMTHTKVI